MLLRSLKRCAGGGKQWAQQQSLDPFVVEARRKGYIARSAFKLLQLDDRYSLLHKTKTRAVLDLGCSPGGWCQVIRERTGDECVIFGVDLLNVRASVPNAVFVQGDFTSPEVQSTLLGHLHSHRLLPSDIPIAKSTAPYDQNSRRASGKIDVVVSDMCPNRSGGTQDRHRVSILNQLALTFSMSLLKERGHFVCKVLGSPASYDELHNTMRRVFHEVYINKPPASRRQSDESYLVGYSMLGEANWAVEFVKSTRYPQEKHFGLDNWPGSARTQQYKDRKERW